MSQGKYQMRIRNTPDRYGWAGIAFHWLVALGVLVLFGIGLYMADLTYYDPLYKMLPDWHRSIGLTLALVVALRLLWRPWMPVPRSHPGHSTLERRAAKVTHGLLYLYLVVTIASGYLISTAKGQGIDVFGLFNVPSITGEVRNMADWSGLVHYWGAWSLVGLAGLHAAGALKHHFIDRDDTLLRML